MANVERTEGCRTKKQDATHVCQTLSSSTFDPIKSIKLLIMYYQCKEPYLFGGKKKRTFNPLNP